MLMRIHRGVDCPNRENLTSIYRCASCQFQKGGIEKLDCGRKEIAPNLLKLNKHRKVYCKVRGRHIKPDTCNRCFFHEGTELGAVRCMAGKFYIRPVIVQ